MTRPVPQIAAIRRKLNEGSKLVTDFRFARLFHDGDRLWFHHDHAEMWRRLTLAIRNERWTREHRWWAHDHNRLMGLHQVRVWLRRQWAMQSREREMA